MVHSREKHAWTHILSELKFYLHLSYVIQANHFVFLSCSFFNCKLSYKIMYVKYLTQCQAHKVEQLKNGCSNSNVQASGLYLVLQSNLFLSSRSPLNSNPKDLLQTPALSHFMTAFLCKYNSLSLKCHPPISLADPTHSYIQFKALLLRRLPQSPLPLQTTLSFMQLLYIILRLSIYFSIFITDYCYGTKSSCAHIQNIVVWIKERLID